MRKLRFTDEALENLADIATYIATSARSRNFARSFVVQIRDRCVELATLPATLGRPRPELRPDLRSVAFRNYVIFFRYLEDRLEVVRVIEGHRDIVGYFAADET